MLKRILLCVNSDIGRGNTIGFRFEQIARELKKQGVEFDIIARSNYSDLSVVTPFFKNYVGRFLNALHIYLFSSLSFRFIDAWIFDLFVLNFIKKQNKIYDLVHFGEYAPKSICFLKKNNSKILIDIPIGHQKYAEYLRENGFEPDEQNFNPTNFIDRSLKQADCLVVPSNFVVETLKYAKIEIPVEVVPFGCYLPNNPEKIIADRVGRKNLSYVFAGSVSMRKGILYLLTAWNNLNLFNDNLVFCGRVYKEAKSIIKEFKKSNVQFVGFKNLDIFFRQADVFVFPSMFEGSAKSVYEAMSYGLPVITTPNSGSVVEDGKSGFIVPFGDSKVLSEKIKYFHDHPEVARQMGRLAYETVKKYSWEAYAKGVIAVYNIYLAK